MISAVEEGEMSLLFHDCSNLFPLILCGIDASGVVSAGVEENNRSFGGVLERRGHAFEVETLGLFREVGIALNREVNIGEDLVVVRPRRVRNINRFGTRVELREEKSAKMDGASA